MEHPAALTKDEISDAIQNLGSSNKAIAQAQLVKAIEWAAAEIDSCTHNNLSLLARQLRSSLAKEVHKHGT